MNRKVIDIREGIILVQERHVPGKLTGFYRALKKSHLASTNGGWCSASLLTATILNQMIQRGSKLWWDIVDLEFGSLVSPDSTRDDIGIRTLAGKIVRDRDSQSFLIVTSTRYELDQRPAVIGSMDHEAVNAVITDAVMAAGLPSGGFMPMLAHLGDAIREAGLKVDKVVVNPEGERSIFITLWDENEVDTYTAYSVRIYPDVLLKDIDLIKSSLARIQGN